jgi:hypothetical protein
MPWKIRIFYRSLLLGHDESVPVMIAQNAPYTSVIFRSFEDISSGTATDYAHSGTRSWSLGTNGVYSPGSVIMSEQIRNNGLTLKTWIKTSDQQDLISNFQVYLDNGSVSKYGQVNVIARVGEWTLAEAKFTGTDIYTNYTNGTSLSVNLKNLGNGIWIDDIRVQPLDAQSVCYVYDNKNLRLLSSFDDQHFGLFYQYNAEGKLVRKLVETERGMKTITETQYNTPVAP